MKNEKRGKNQTSNTKERAYYVHVYHITHIFLFTRTEIYCRTLLGSNFWILKCKIHSSASKLIEPFQPTTTTTTTKKMFYLITKTWHINKILVSPKSNHFYQAQIISIIYISFLSSTNQFNSLHKYQRLQATKTCLFRT